jgi:hypothetical protein
MSILEMIASTWRTVRVEHLPVQKPFASRLALALAVVIVAAATVAIRHYLSGSGSAEGVYVVQADDAPELSVHLIIPHGGGVPGLAHYTEHLTWLPNMGKDARPQDRHSNAWTTPIAVGYWLSGSPDDLQDMLGRLGGVFKPIDLPRTFAEEERDIIQREYDLRMANNIDAEASVAMDAFLYQGNAVAAHSLGTPELIAAFSYDEAKAFHVATHRPERARLVVTGDVSDGALRRAMTAVGFPDLSGSREDIKPSAFTLAAPETKVFTYPLPQAAPRMIWRKVVTLPEPVDFDLLEVQSSLLRDILDTDLPGGLAGPLRFDAFITKGFGLSIEPIDEDNVELVFWADPDKGVSFAAMQAAFEAAFSASAQGIPPATYDRVRKRFKAFWPDWDDEKDVGGWMADYVLYRVSNLREPLSTQQVYGLDGQLRPEDIDALLKALAGPGRVAIAFIGKDPPQ